MGVKHKISPENFQEALDYLGTSISDIAKQTGIPRAYLSDLKNRNVPLRREHADILAGYFETEGVPFSDEAVPPANLHPSSITSLHPQLGVGFKQEHYFPISNTVPDDVVRNAMNIMDENDARLVVLLKTKIERDEGILKDGDLTDETKAALQETFALLAGNYITFRMLRGWSALKLKPATDKPETVHDMVLQTFMQQFVDAGLIAAPLPAETATASEEEGEEVAA